MLQVPGVKEATVTGFLPIPSARCNNPFFKDVSMDIKAGLDIQRWEIDYDYIKFMGIKIIKGRDFSNQYGTDTSAIIINEEAAKQLGYTNPIGENLYSFNDPNFKNQISYKIIGVVKDFHFESLKQEVGPLSFILKKNNGACSFRIEASNITYIVKQTENKWKDMFPGMPFNYHFMNESFNELYKAERNAGLTTLAAAIFAILVACLGLFGLSTFMVQQRTKEIGIRKVLGASVAEVFILLSKEFTKWVLIANIIAWPVGYYFMNKWLQDFAYRIDMSWWMFALSGGIALFIALATVSFQAIKAAVANPIDALRYE
jgi:putative ABC transport system permease protein